MKKEYRAHPIMMLSLIKPFLFILILPFIKAILQYFIDKQITDVLEFGMMIFVGLSIAN